MSLKEKILAQLGIFTKTPDGLQYYMQDNEVYIVGYKGSKKQVFHEIPAYIEDCPVVSLKNLQEMPLVGEIRIPDTVREIYDLCFEFQKKVTKFLIPDSVESIGEHAFEFCDNLEEMIFPDNLTLLPLGICSENPKLKKIHLPESLEEIPDCFAGGCSSLEEMIIPESVKIIGELA
ncbi:MAG: leucine-rich repeat domain-containing protein, partial [Oscillospiraceae bacterium]|nr:leucine-rich repeat domain-containing protein [Oscillospiraceae bacterium]